MEATAKTFFLLTLTLINLINARALDAQIDHRIVGGNEVEPNSLPYQAGLYITKNATLYLCGGVLVSQLYVLTTGNCMIGADNVQVRLGAHRISDTEETQLRITSFSYYIHSNFNATSLINDIASIRLPEPIEFNEYIQPIALPTQDQAGSSFVDNWARISGWGRDSDSSSTFSPVLRSADVQVITNTNCILFYGIYITPGHICTSGVDGVGACGGDAGGPLVINSTLVGIISFNSASGCEGGAPTASTRITAYLDWVENHTDVIID